MHVKGPRIISCVLLIVSGRNSGEKGFFLRYHSTFLIEAAEGPHLNPKP